MKNGVLPIKEESRYQYIDSLRGWSVLMIILMHAGAGGGTYPFPEVAGSIIGQGYVGIHMLFVATGLSLSLRWSAASLGSRDGLRRYTIRRACRIVPLWYLAIVLYLILLGRNSRNLDWLDVALTASFLHNWRWSSINTVVPGGWSIGADATFYVLFPLLVRWAGSRRVFWALVVGGVAATQFMNLYTQAHHWNQGFSWSFPGTGVIFLFGMAVGRCLGNAREGSRTGSLAFAGNTVSVCLLAFLIAGLPFWHLPDWLLTYRLQVATVAGLLCVFLHEFPARLVVNPIMAQVGRMTFSILVLHIIVLTYAGTFGAWLADQIAWQPSDEFFLPIYLSSVVCGSLALGFLGFTLIERPTIHLGRRLTQGAPSAGLDQPQSVLRS
jgi:exopolysaccharide production protein ExoZ